MLKLGIRLGLFSKYKFKYLLIYVIIVYIHCLNDLSK